MSGVPVPRRRFLYGAVVFRLTGNAALANAGGRRMAGPVLAQAGLRVDRPNAPAARFPAANLDLVRQRIRNYFETSKPDFLVTSAACGTDLLSLEVAGELSIKRVVLLPTDPGVFRVSSVADRPGNWGEMFDQLLKEVNVEILDVPGGQTGYLETNIRLLERAQTLASSNNTVARALVVWDKKPRGPDDVTGHFLAQARLRKMPVVEISTLKWADVRQLLENQLLII
jgi:hypothetical protein